MLVMNRKKIILFIKCSYKGDESNASLSSFIQTIIDSKDLFLYLTSELLYENLSIDYLYIKSFFIL